MTFPHTSDDQPVLFMPGERVEFTLHAEAGALLAHQPEGDVLTVTNRRAIRTGASTGVRTTSLLPLGKITGVDVLDVSRPTERLGQGILLLVVGLALGGTSWVVVNLPIVSLLLGGIPILAAVYALAGWAFPDAEGELRLHAPGQTVSQPLRSTAARRDAYRAAQRIYELIAGPADAPPPAGPGPVGAPDPNPAQGTGSPADSELAGAPDLSPAHGTGRPVPDRPAPAATPPPSAREAPGAPARMPNPLEDAVLASLGSAKAGPPDSPEAPPPSVAAEPPAAVEPAEENATPRIA